VAREIFAQNNQAEKHSALVSSFFCAASQCHAKFFEQPDRPEIKHEGKCATRCKCRPKSDSVAQHCRHHRNIGGSGQHVPERRLRSAAMRSASLVSCHSQGCGTELRRSGSIPRDDYSRDGLHFASEPQSGIPVSQKTLEKPRTKVKPKTQRPPLWKVILLNDDYTPREFVVLVLKAVFRMNESHAYKVMMTAHQRGACVIAVYARDVAETKAKEATEMGRGKGYPLYFTTEKEE
jgi:ATP-dependent Clp protease adaptor protein ClpS